MVPKSIGGITRRVEMSFNFSKLEQLGLTPLVRQVSDTQVVVEFEQPVNAAPVLSEEADKMLRHLPESVAEGIYERIARMFVRQVIVATVAE